jgi:RNA polymerase sigma-70 factor (ECF subfamily)
MTEQGRSVSVSKVEVPRPAESAARLTFRQVYDTYFAFVWRAAANRGVPDAALDDVVQEVFLVVHRKLGEFEGRSTVRTWLSSVVRRVVSGHVRKRGNQPAAEEPLLEEPAAAVIEEPAVETERRAALAVLDDLLAKMMDVQREVFVLYELEEMTVREIADLTGANENTVQTRLRAARRIFQQGVVRHRARAAREEA